MDSHQPDQVESLRDHGESIPERTLDLLEFDTQNPPSQTPAAIDWLETRFTELGLATERYALAPAKPNLLATPEGTTDTVLTFNGHVDTVPFEPAEGTRDPLVEREGERVCGRGATEMMGQIASMLSTARAFVDAGTTPPVTLGFVLVSDEEVSGDARLPLLDAGRLRAGGCVIGEPTREDGPYSESVADRGSIWLTREARGEAVPGSRPLIGGNAIDRLYDAVTLLRERFSHGEKCLPRITDSPRGIDMGDPFVVIGGDAAGMSAASKAKRDDPDREIIAFERGDWVSYAACGMPYFVKGDVDALEDLVQVTPDAFRTERGIDLRTNHEVVGIDVESRTVTVSTDGDRFSQPYGQLLVATGARAIEPPFDGVGLDGVFTIHDMDEAEAIDAAVADSDPETAAIVGGGYVGIEMAEALVARGLDVHLFEMLPHVLQPFGEAVGSVVEDHLREQGVELHLDTPVEGFSGVDRVDAVELEADAVPADLVVVGVGVAPNVELADEAGIDLGETGAIATDAYGRTSADGVFAAGDCAEATNVVTGEPDHVPLALTANRAGRSIGQTVTGTPTRVGEIAGTAIVKAFDLGAARTGVIEEKTAREAGFDPVSTEITAPTRAHYYPGAAELTVTLVADSGSKRVLGASLVGREGVKRIDTVATALHGTLDVTEVQNLDLAYAPPFSPVWDPVATAAKVLGGSMGNAP